VGKEQTREMVKREVARLLSQERQRRGLSMNSLAARSGLSQATISGFESGNANPTLESLLRMAEVLDVDLGEILTEAIKGRSKGSRS
jgi:transcriptional regulator with XRE-family HTH domain